MGKVYYANENLQMTIDKRSTSIDTVTPQFSGSVHVMKNTSGRIYEVITRETVIQEMHQTLAEKNIHSAMELISYGVEKFEDEIGVKEIGIILRSKMKDVVHVHELIKLAKHLGRDLKEEIKADLKNRAGIHNQKTLREYTQHRFVETFGLKRVGIINGKYSRANQKDLVEFGENLGRDLQEEIIGMLSHKGIHSALDLLRKDNNELGDIKKYVGMFLNQTINNIAINEKYALCEKLHRDIPKEIADGINRYREIHPPLSMISAIKSLRLKYNSIVIIEKFLPQITEYLGHDIINIAIWEFEEEMRQKYQVCDRKDYEKLTCQQMRKFGLQRIGLMVGYTVYDITSQIKADLGKKLGYV